MLKRLTSLIALSTFLSLILIALPSQPASAAKLYNNETKGICKEGDIPLDPGHKHKDKTYFCVKGLQPTEYTLTTTENCAEGIGRFKGFGFYCLTALKNPEFGEGSVNTDEVIGRNKDADNAKCSDGGGADDVCGIFDKFLNPAINFLAIGFGVIVTILIIVGGIQYSSSGGDPQKAAEAKKRISNAIFALIAFAFLYAFLQWIVPGGAF